MAIACRLRVAAAPLSRLRFGQINRRSFRSAAQLQYDYDYDYEESPSAMEEDSQGSVPGRGVQWVVMGDPFTNRHVYAERLWQLLKVPHISMSTLIRQELHPRSSLYKQGAHTKQAVPVTIANSFFGSQFACAPVKQQFSTGSFIAGATEPRWGKNDKK